MIDFGDILFFVKLMLGVSVLNTFLSYLFLRGEFSLKKALYAFLIPIFAPAIISLFEFNLALPTLKYLFPSVVNAGRDGLALDIPLSIAAFLMLVFFISYFYKRLVGLKFWQTIILDIASIIVLCIELYYFG